MSAESLDRFKKGSSWIPTRVARDAQWHQEAGQRVYGVGAPSRSSTLINYVGLHDGILDCVLEIAGSYKIGKYVPGRVPVVDERKLFDDPPDYALRFRGTSRTS